MNIYTLEILSPEGHGDRTLEAEAAICSATTYAFYIKNKMIACYPVDRTIIKKIETIKVDEEGEEQQEDPLYPKSQIERFLKKLVWHSKEAQDNVLQKFNEFFK